MIHPLVESTIVLIFNRSKLVDSIKLLHGNFPNSDEFEAVFGHIFATHFLASADKPATCSKDVGCFFKLSSSWLPLIQGIYCNKLNTGKDQEQKIMRIRMIQMIYDYIVNENLCQTVLST